MANLSHYWSKRLIDISVGHLQTLNSPSSLYLALYTTDPTAADTGTEVAGSGYARVQIPSWAVASLIDGRQTVKNTTELIFPTATGQWTSAAYWGIRDAMTGGNLIAYGTLANEITVNDGDTPRAPADEISISFA